MRVEQGIVKNIKFKPANSGNLPGSGVKITILVDNQASDGLVAEHGLALWIETKDTNILFDTGQGNALEPNAKALGINLAKTNILVLSHGHYDHTGGINRVIRQSRHVDVYCHPAIVQPRYSIRNGKAKSIRMPKESVEVFASIQDKYLHWVQHPTMLLLSAGIGITGPVPRKTDFEDAGGPFYLDPDGERPDPIADDMALWIWDDNGIIVCVGCAHSGIVNTLDYIWHLGNSRRIRAVIGGFHLHAASHKKLSQTIAALQAFDPALLIPCHCTGDTAVDQLRQAFGDRVSPGAAGKTFQF
jgi:7,8-dihydropterin-6-yl-methyl-4-(beta-D-ribofuranosyl)aminobenzene 5'-phosphate synthase